MKLSKNFDLDEFTFSQKAIALGIDNTPNDIQIKNMRYLCQAVLQPLRDLIERPITILSGYRCLTLNAAVHGDDGSHHLCSGNYAAADFVPNGESIEEVKRILLGSDFPFEQLIIYDGSDGQGERLHVSARRPDREILVAKQAKNGKTYYELVDNLRRKGK